MINRPKRAEQPQNTPENTGMPGVHFLYNLDQPTKRRLVSPADSCEIVISGWAGLTSGRSVNVSVSVDGRQVAEQAATQPRPDVPPFFAKNNLDMPLHSGYRLAIEVDGIDSADRVVVVSFSDMDSGKVYDTATITIERFKSLRYETIAKVDKDHARSHYKEVWNLVSGDVDSAKISVAGYTDEDEFAKAAKRTLRILKRTTGVQPDDTFLEIGCGVGRVGRALSPHCRKWIGCDVSENMLVHARERLSDLNNIELVPLNGWDLASIPDASVDVVYCTVVFMHLDEWDRFNYICEGFRVLKPGGRIYVDNFNLLSTQGWKFFMQNMLDYHPLERPANISKSSTPSELRMYLQQAGFENIRVGEGKVNLWVAAWGQKPAPTAAA